jgi:hypothetical protein
MGPQIKHAVWGRLARGGGIFLVMLTGCCSVGSGGYSEGGMRDPGSNPAPNGTYVTMWLDEHANRAEASDFTIYLNEWYLGGTDLGPGLPTNILLQGLEDFSRELFCREFSLRRGKSLAILLTHPTLELDGYVLGIGQERGVTPASHDHSTIFQNVNRRWRHIHLVVVLEDAHDVSFTSRDARVCCSEVDSIDDSVTHPRILLESADDAPGRLTMMPPGITTCPRQVIVGATVSSTTACSDSSRSSRTSTTSGTIPASYGRPTKSITSMLNSSSVAVS